MIEQLRAIVGAQHVLVDDDLRAGYEVDWTGRFRGATPAVVRPGSVDEVAAVVRACSEAETRIVPQGGNTGLVGGGVPLGGEVVLSLRRLSAIEPVDALAAQVTVGAGATLGAVQDAAKAAGLAFGVDLSARDSATIGGMVATNAGGLHHIRHGSMRANVVGVEAVLADGSIVRRLSGLTKDNTGYDLTSLLCGSEGTLGIVTAARLRLVPRAHDIVTAIVAMRSVAAAVEAVATLRRHITLDAAEVWLDLPSPVDAPVSLLVEWSGSVDALGVLDADAVVADDETRRHDLWHYRESITEAINSVGVPHKMDVTLPAAQLATFCDEVPRVTAPHRTFLFGHLGDGNIHVNVVGPDPDDETVDDAVFRLVAMLGGSISAEHGIGTAKNRWLHLARSDAELAAMRAIKQALDPRGILNPNVLAAPA
ncbi:MAG TPA: FAD-binding oxidoreductase [Acidimicrobiales bacterium]|nr:FAD-binding oxidoreductase [Acidimicrobiales bacterium]